jgi:hypothetical protein
MKARPFLEPNLVWAGLILIAATEELLINELYFKLAAEVPRLMLIGLVAGAVLLLVGIARRLAPEVLWISRLAVFAGLGTWLAVVGSPALHNAFGAPALSDWVLIVVSLLLAGGALGAPWWRERLWAAFRRVVAVACLLFVTSQPVVAFLRAPVLSWPEWIQQDPASSPTNDVTVFLLLDELNAKSGGAILQALKDAGWATQSKALTTVGNSTSQVVPAMLTQRRFDNAKPCGLKTICSQGNVLDFSKVVASRPDVDVVGFYHPYCAMQGLRFCAHLAPASPAFHAKRWWCAAQRRSAWLSSVTGRTTEGDCSALNGVVWDGLAAQVEQALWRAPVWERGGFLFAHVPLPHLPGEKPGATIVEHYQANIERAARLVGRVALRINQMPNRRARIVIFSDHPLREGLWCNSTQYQHNGCPLPPEWKDDKVPLIVAGELSPVFSQVESNKDVFLIAQPPR